MKLNGLYVSNILNGVICFAVIVISAVIEAKKFPTSMEELMAIPKKIGV
ncbi:MAG: hypothetical protein K5869_04155 [Saccharofermentans sp.]|nr:hypothetical protein [Saccharofermentans sp.]